MESAPQHRRNLKRDARSAKRSEAIAAFLDEFAPSAHQDLLEQIMVTVCRLAKDQAGRGELKILSRALMELRYAFKVFAPYDHIPKVTIFGSSRTPKNDPAYLQAKNFAERMEKEGWMVITGAGDGIMRAGHHGAKRKSSFGVAISLPVEQSTNDIISGDSKCIHFNYFFTRKLLFIKEAEAIVLFPGGYGTQDENFETLTLIQTGKADVMPVVLCDAPGGDYWKSWKAYVEDRLLKTGMISLEDFNFFTITDNAERAVDEILHFYKRYHSSRMVRDNLVIRLKSPLPADVIEQLNDEFNDLLVSGKIKMRARPLSEEGNAFPDLTRLVLKFNRLNFGRLRLLINAVNNA